MFRFLFGKKDTVLLPWAGKESIYKFIKQNLGSDGCLPKEFDKLPDDEEFFEGQPFRWVSGGMDGAFGHHCGGGDDPEKRAAKLVKLLRKQIRNPENSTRRATYLELMKDNLLDFIDPFLNSLRNQSDLNSDTLFEEALWFATKGTHRGVVKAGIAILGMFESEEDCEVIMTLGKHEEFTLYSSVAIQNGAKEPNKKLFELAKCVNGWGKINLVERLNADTDEIKDWLLRNGCQNSIMNEYLAYICATKGELKEALNRDSIDYELYEGAGIIIDALINGGPAEDMDDYGYSMNVIADYIRHSLKHAKDLGDLLTIIRIKSYLEEEGERWEGRYQSGWTKNEQISLLALCNKLIEKNDWESLIWEDIESTDNCKRYNAIQAAKALGLDAWPNLFKQLTMEPLQSSLYYELMQTDEKDRIKRLVEFAVEKLPLSDMVGEPSDNLGLGQEYEPHYCLDFILQDLDKFEGIGHCLISVGLRSPLVRNRNMALNALEYWSMNCWPEEVIEVLTKLAETEPDEELKERVLQLLKKK